MSWNHRLLAHEDGPDIYLAIHEVYYNDNGTPDSYTENPVTVGGNSHKEVFEVLKMMTKGALSPVLWVGERFPEEYVEQKDNEL